MDQFPVSRQLSRHGRFGLALTTQFMAVFEYAQARENKRRDKLAGAEKQDVRRIPISTKLPGSAELIIAKGGAMIRTLVVAAVIAFVTGGFVSGQAHPAAKTVTVDAFDVIGIKCRTNNANEAAGKGCIGRQWEHLMGGGLLQKIPSRSDNNIVAVYTDYASDKDGDYTYILGAKVKPGTPAPSGMVKTTIKAGHFAIFTSDKGPVQQVVPTNWKRIWELPKSQPGGDRLYQSDFELYDERAADPKSAEMDIFIRVR